MSRLEFYIIFILFQNYLKPGVKTLAENFQGKFGEYIKIKIKPRNSGEDVVVKKLSVKGCVKPVEGIIYFNFSFK